METDNYLDFLINKDCLNKNVDNILYNNYTNDIEFTSTLNTNVEHTKFVKNNLLLPSDYYD